MKSKTITYIFLIWLLFTVSGFAQNSISDTESESPFSLESSDAIASAGALVTPNNFVQVRLKDIARLKGVRKNQLFGIGLVTGLSGTGDDTNSVKFTAQAIANMLNNMGISANSADIRVKNFAAVMVTADLPAFAKPGDQIDVTISSMGNAKSLDGGTLLMTPLQAANGDIYAVAQGSVTLGAFGASGKSGSGVKKNFLTVGRIPSGAIVEQEVPFSYHEGDVLTWILRDNDFTTALNIADSINKNYPDAVALAIDPSTIQLRIPRESWSDPIEFVSKLEQIEVSVDSISRVVINEKNGTIVLGGQVKILPVSIAHGNITVSVSETYNVSQPDMFSSGRTTVVPDSGVQVVEGAAEFVNVTSENLVKSLNQMGATAQDIVAIFQAIKAAGALEAELVII